VARRATRNKCGFSPPTAARKLLLAAPFLGGAPRPKGGDGDCMVLPHE